MICPWGDHELLVPTRAEYSVLTYGDSALTVTACCGCFVRLYRVQTTSARMPSEHDLAREEDDWGIRRSRRSTRP